MFAEIPVVNINSTERLEKNESVLFEYRKTVSDLGVPCT
jgi:hypothetical protein